MQQCIVRMPSCAGVQLGRPTRGPALCASSKRVRCRWLQATKGGPCEPDTFLLYRRRYKWVQLAMACALPRAPPTHSVSSVQAGYYELLEVEEDASRQEIVRAFRRKARTMHPDVNRADDAEERFMELLAAYQALTDDVARQSYDQEVGTVRLRVFGRLVINSSACTPCTAKQPNSIANTTAGWLPGMLHDHS